MSVKNNAKNSCCSQAPKKDVSSFFADCVICPNHSHILYDLCGKMLSEELTAQCFPEICNVSTAASEIMHFSVKNLPSVHSDTLLKTNCQNPWY